MSDAEDGPSIADIVFQRSRTEQLVAEGLFGPALAYLVSQTHPAGIQGAILSWFMAALVGIPILRYLVFTDRIAEFDRLLGLTVRPVELFALLGLAQVFKYIATAFVQPFAGLNVLESTAVVTAIALIVYVTGFELIFQKYQFSWGTLFYVKRLVIEQEIGVRLEDIDEVAKTITQESSPVAQLRVMFWLLVMALLRVTFGQTAFHLLRGSIPDREDDAIEELRTFVKMNESGHNLTDSRGLWFAFGVCAVVILPTLALIGELISLVLASFGTIILVMFIMRLTKHIVALSYIAFGTMDYEQFVTTNKRWLVMVVTYTVSVYLLIFYPL